MKIKLTEQEAKLFSWGDLEGFTLIETIEDVNSIYKEKISTETIGQQDSTGKFFSLQWNKSLAHFGHCEHDFYSLELCEVESFEVVKVTKEWRAV